MNTKNNNYTGLIELEREFNDLEQKFYEEQIGTLETSFLLLMYFQKFHQLPVAQNDAMTEMYRRICLLEAVVKNKLMEALELTPEETQDLYENHLFTITQEVIGRLAEQHLDKLLKMFKDSKTGTPISIELKKGGKLEVYLENLEELIKEITEEEYEEEMPSEVM